MILTVLRNELKIPSDNKWYCDDIDFNSGLELTKTLLRHSQHTFNSVSSGTTSILDDTILDSLPKKFSRKEAIDVGVINDVPKRTIDDKLKQWQGKKIISKVKTGIYTKR